MGTVTFFGNLQLAHCAEQGAKKVTVPIFLRRAVRGRLPKRKGRATTRPNVVPLPGLEAYLFSLGDTNIATIS
jgi:hypothetical protein